MIAVVGGPPFRLPCRYFLLLPPEGEHAVASWRVEGGEPFSDALDPLRILPLRGRGEQAAIPV